MATAAELTGEEIAAVAESLSDPANLNVDTMAAIMHRIGPGLMALGQKVLVALIIFLIGRKVISMIEKMLSRWTDFRCPLPAINVVSSNCQISVYFDAASFKYSGEYSVLILNFIPVY